MRVEPNPAKPLPLIPHYLQFLTFQRILRSPKFRLLPEKTTQYHVQKKDVFSPPLWELQFFSLCMTVGLFCVFTEREETQSCWSLSTVLFHGTSYYVHNFTSDISRVYHFVTSQGRKKNEASTCEESGTVSSPYIQLSFNTRAVLIRNNLTDNPANPGTFVCAWQQLGWLEIFQFQRCKNWSRFKKC